MKIKLFEEWVSTSTLDYNDSPDIKQQVSTPSSDMSSDIKQQSNITKNIPWGVDELSPVLQKAREQGKPFDQITIFDCSSMNLKNLDGIEQLVSLERLYCSYGNQLTSLRGIENLRNLKELYCSNNQLTSLEGIENLRGLKELYCNANQLTRLDGIEKLRNLEILTCSYNQLTNLRGIENLRNLKRLWCHNNQFTKEYKEYLRNYCKEKNINFL
jgi:Leucine-rich repeat (LRR) protein